MNDFLCEAVTDKMVASAVKRVHGPSPGEEGEVTGGEVSMERSKEVRGG